MMESINPVNECQATKLNLSSVTISEKRISKIDGNREILSIPIDEIQHISLRYGSPVERPFAQLVIGVILLGLGYFLGVLPVYGIIVLGYTLSYSVAWATSSALTMLLLGGWFILQIFTKQFFLQIKTKGDSRKIVFDSFLYESEVRSFVKDANERFRLQVLDDVK